LSSSCSRPLGVGCSIGSIEDCLKLQREKGIGGTFSQLLRVPERNAVRLPAEVGFPEASLAEPLADVIKSIENAGADAETDKSVLIVGGGPIGLLHVIVARSRGLKEIIVVEPIEMRRRLAEQLGATAALDPSGSKLTETICSLTRTSKIDAIILTASGKAQEQLLPKLIPVINRGGTIVVFASSHPSVNFGFDLNWIHYNSIRIVGVVGYRDSNFLDSLEVLRKFKDDAKLLISPILGLERIQEAFNSYGGPGVLKVGIDPHTE
jgi:L-iditol 2-dehydrogenase